MDLGQSCDGILGRLLVDLTSRVDDVLRINLLEGLGGSCSRAGRAQGTEDDLGQVCTFVGEGGGDVFKVDGLLFEDREVGEAAVVLGWDGAATEGQDSRKGV